MQEINQNANYYSASPHQIVKERAKKLFEGARKSHKWEHTLRVYKLCERIGSAEGADMDVLLIAAYLHDVGRCFQDASNGAICHAEKGAEMAESIVDDLPLSEMQKKNIVSCVKSHRFRGNHLPKTTEAMVLFDADKLDAIGAVGVARAFLFAGEIGARLHNPDVDVEDTRAYSKDDTGFREFKVKLSRIKDRLLTQKGQEMARERHDFMAAFFKRFIEEYDGKR